MARMKRAPKSYLNRSRPPIQEAMALEGNMSICEAVKSLERKGYFTPRPRPWSLGFKDRGHGFGDWAILDRFGDLVAEVENKADAELIILAVNAKDAG
ncbi:MAG: hypothetical protein ABIF06_02540 [bacterium]